MIAESDITKWGADRPWPTREQIEQDLLLSQAICEIANNQLLGNEFVIRGGTAFHKLFLPRARRYSEDLDYVRSTAGGIGVIMTELTQVGEKLGYRVNTRIGKYPKVFWKGIAESGLPLRIKIEINTYERTPALPLITLHHNVVSDYYSSGADVRIFQAEELIATKIRALYQRSKGRDLFDLWLALETLGLAPAKIMEVFKHYRPETVTAELMINNLEKKLEDKQFLEDMDGLVVPSEIEYQPRIAADIVIAKLLKRLDE